MSGPSQIVSTYLRNSGLNSRARDRHLIDLFRGVLVTDLSLIAWAIFDAFPPPPYRQPFAEPKVQKRQTFEASKKWRKVHFGEAEHLTDQPI